ncbi:cob(I)yrinic acid a,c-diamide adenosyltransferase [Halostagnicola sp. A-GB9-2]|uniref:cob(I)yrinic acid a,c-diamide adenosyltransferase n=1 Tax=Halostagnicola sp. A-GB9-2 TaxID=3048066 RepID=UPI0024BF5A63|nr:cob(I)yrinic acid a,c-diamide adenosyltransferase [Halostagnicola sp. A-GB9-2]MDJ1434089.1 cob(I)yrinic acid a,c-diamide adenosyltransferase [Halostagnicola sp. A-GB9-2]
MTTDRTPEETLENTPGKGLSPEADEIEPAAPDEFGLVQVWWGDGKGKTTATLGMGMRAAGHGYRVHVLQFMKGGASSVDAVRGEYNAIAALPGISYENLGHYGWHGMEDGSDETDHKAEAQAGLERTKELLEAAQTADLSTPFSLSGKPSDGVHMLILDEILYAADRELIEKKDVRDLIDAKPEDLELVLSGSHTHPEYLVDEADLITNVRKEKHPIDENQRARRGTEF